VATYLEFKNGDQSIFVEVDPPRVDRKPASEDGKASPGYNDDFGDSEDGKASLNVKDVFQSSLLKVERSFSDAFSALRVNAEAFMSEVSAIDIKPSEIEMTFGLKASGELGNFAVGKITADANYTVKMVWKK
jgi:hypothetical protein